MPTCDVASLPSRRPAKKRITLSSLVTSWPLLDFGRRVPATIFERDERTFSTGRNPPLSSREITNQQDEWSVLEVELTYPHAETTPVTPIEGSLVCYAVEGLSSDLVESDAPGYFSKETEQANTKPCQNVWLCSPPPSPEAELNAPFPTETRPNIEFKTTSATVTSSRPARGRAFITRSTSSARLAQEFDEDRRVICLSTHTERVLRGAVSPPYAFNSVQEPPTSMFVYDREKRGGEGNCVSETGLPSGQGSMRWMVKRHTN